VKASRPPIAFVFLTCVLIVVAASHANGQGLSGSDAWTLTAKCVCERFGPVREMIERLVVGRVEMQRRDGNGA
jgi:hypothetical protein